MKSITFRGAAAYLLDDVPHWAGPIELRATIPVRSDAGLTGREARRPLGDTLRLGLTYGCYLRGASEVTAWRNALQALHTQPVLCPVWPAWFNAGDAPPFTTEYYALIDEDSAAEIKTDAERPFTREAYPLIVGRLDGPAQPVLMTDEDAEVSVNFVEDDSTSITMAAYMPLLAFGRPILPWHPNWQPPVQSGSADVEVERRELAHRRQTSAADYDAKARRPISMEIVPDPWLLLRFFQDLGGQAGTIWVPGGISEARLAADVAVSDLVLSVDNPAARGNNTVVILDDHVNRAICLITSTTGNDWNLSGYVGYDFDKGKTRIETCLLARFKSREIALRFQAPELCTAALDFVEVPWETTGQSAPGESATTMGTLPATCYLYQFQVEYPDGVRTWTYTGFERDLTFGGLTFISAGIEHSTVRESLGMESNQIEIQCPHATDNPLASFLPFTLEFPLELHVWEATVAYGAVTVARRVFRGEVSTVQANGPFLTASARILGSIFDRRIPRKLIQKSCNWTIFDVHCGVLQQNFRWVGKVDTWDEASGEMLVSGLQWLGMAPEAPSVDGHWFAGGLVQIGTGTACLWRLIQQSQLAGVDEILITLGSRLPSTPSAGTEVQLWPGCDGQYATCVDKFDNAVRFGGYPHIPLGHALGWTLKTQGDSAKK